MDLDTTQTEKLLDGMKIPPAPYILQQLNKEIQNDEPDLMAIAEIISADVGLAGLILRTVNSPMFGLTAKVQSIQHATSLLGISYAVNIISGLLLRRTFEESESGNPPRFWDSPVNIAMASTYIAQTIGSCEPDEMYMLGLFHNSGHALLMQRFTDYRTFLDENSNSEKATLTQLENERYATDHAVLGYYLARSWGVDKHISEIIRDHHNVAEALSDSAMDLTQGSMLALLKMAEHVDKLYWGIEDDHEWSHIENQVLEYLGLSNPDFEEIRDDSLERLESG